MFGLVQDTETAAVKTVKEMHSESSSTPVMEAVSVITNTRTRKLSCNGCLGVTVPQLLANLRIQNATAITELTTWQELIVTIKTS